MSKVALFQLFGAFLFAGGLTLILLSFRTENAKQQMINQGKSFRTRSRWLLRLLGIIFSGSGLRILGFL